MKKTVFSLVLALAGMGLTATSCQEMLTPELVRYAENFSGKDTVNFYLGIMRELQSVAEQHTLLGELRGDLITPTEYVSDSISDIINFRNLRDGESQLLNAAAYYKVINQCNHYLERADSMAMRNNKYYMRRELAQVALVRAWTYMQLVQNYGEVPFITRFVSNSNTGWETNPAEGRVNADNLLEKLKPSLEQAYNYSETLGYINYGTFTNGFSSFAHRAMLFNADVIYGDLYLLRGKNTADYEKAAYHYHRFLEHYTSGVTGIASIARTERGTEIKYSSNTNTWLGLVGATTSFSGGGEYVTSVPTASNTSFGQLLTRIPQIYGYDPTSRTSSSTTSATDGSSTTVASGSVSIVPNYRNRQVEPSSAYDKLNEDAIVLYNEFPQGRNSEQPKKVEYPAISDARYHGSVRTVITTDGHLRFIQKHVNSGLSNSEGYSSGFSFRMGIPLYRLRQIYLRYAEAINRAGYPRYAFEILRTGLRDLSIPKLKEVAVPIGANLNGRDTVYTDDTKTDILRINATVRLDIDSVVNGANGIQFSERYRAKQHSWLDFSKFRFIYNTGIRQAGAGQFYDADTLWTYEKVVDARLKQEAARLGTPYVKLSALTATVAGNTPDSVRIEKKVNERTNDAYELVTHLQSSPYMAATPQEIAAMETIIADELALETAFEGFRYYDLMRLARHRNAAGENGNEWLAWLISRRDLKLKPYEQPQQKGALYSKLIDMNNWFLPLPVVQ